MSYALEFVPDQSFLGSGHSDVTDPLAIPAFLDRTIIVGTFTMLHCYESICPHQCYRRYIKEDIKFIKTEAMAYGDRVHEAMEHRIGGNKPLPDDMRQWEPIASAFTDRGARVEMKLGLTTAGHSCDFFAGSVKFRCKVDLHIIKGTKIYIADHKTGNSKYEDPFELKVQAMHLHAKYPELKQFTGQYIWLKENRLGKPYDLSNTAATWIKCNTIFDKIEADRKAGHFEKRQGPLCGFCPVEDCEHNKTVKMGR